LFLQLKVRNDFNVSRATRDVMSAHTQFASAEFRGVSDITAKSVYGSALKVKKTNMQSRGGKLFPLLLVREFELYMFDRVEQKLLGS
jgi:hypothetical protein